MQSAPQVARELVPMTRKRGVLVVYVDFLFFTAVWEPIAWVFTPYVPWIDGWVGGLVFGGVEWLTFRLFGASPGCYALGIYRIREPEAHRASIVEEKEKKTPLFVFPELWHRETWWTILAGVLLILEGSKNLVRWTQGLPPPPLFGLELSSPASFALTSLVGAINIAAGILILRLRRVGAVIGAGICLIEVAAVAPNSAVFRRWIEVVAIQRRALQGRAIRDDEIEFMQTVVPPSLIVGTAVLIVLLGFVYQRAGRPANDGS